MRTKTLQIFLSHSGHDAKMATKIARMVQDHMNDQRYPVKVFCTSLPEDRFKEEVSDKAEKTDKQTLKARLAKALFGISPERSPLEKFLAENINKSIVFLSLLSKKSAKANSEYIQYELEIINRYRSRKRKSDGFNAYRFYVPLIMEDRSSSNINPFDQLTEDLKRVQGLIVDPEDSENRWLGRLGDYLVKTLAPYYYD